MAASNERAGRVGGSSRVARTLSVALLLAYGCGTGAGDSGLEHVSADEAARGASTAALGDAERAVQEGQVTPTLAAPSQAAPPPNANVAPALQIACDTASCCPAGTSAISYTQNSDTVNSATANRCLVTLGGADTVSASGAGSAVLAGAGDDIVMAGPGSRVRASTGNDTVNGFSGGVVTGGAGNDTLASGNGDNYVWPGEGADNVTLGDGNDKAVIFAVCESLPGESLSGGSGNDILVTPLPIAQLQSLGMTVSGFESVIIQNNACYSPCVQQPTCQHGGWCAPGAGPSDLICQCPPEWEGPHCEFPACTDADDNDGDGLLNCYEVNDADPWTDKAIFNGVQVTQAAPCHAAPTCGLADSRSEIEACDASIVNGLDRPEYRGWDFQDPQSLALCSPEYGFQPDWPQCANNPFQLHYEGRLHLSQAGQHCFKVSGTSSGACGSLLLGTQTAALTTAGAASCFSLAAGDYPIRWFYETAGVSTPATPLWQADFTAVPSDFTYFDDQFRSTTQPTYASGLWSATGGYASTGGLTVTLGGINNTVVLGMSGGWKRTFVVTAANTYTLSFRYKLTQSPNYESSETSQLLVSLDGSLRGLNGNDYVAQLVGDADGGPSITTGWQQATLNLGTLSPKTYTLVLGGYNSRKDNLNEFTDAAFDDVVLRPTTNVVGGGSLHVQYCFGGAASCTPTAALPSTALRLPEGVCGPNECSPNCPCDPGGECDSNDDCVAGLVCGADNGRYFQKPPFSDHCWDPSCDYDRQYGGCGTITSPCGICDPDDPDSCVSDADCRPDEKCGDGNGVYYGLGPIDVCWPDDCSPATQATQCEHDQCGNCDCIPNNCSSATCGDPTGCGTNCPGACTDGNDCETSVDCAAGSICGNGNGAQFGKPPTSDVCWPEECEQMDASKPGCNVPAGVNCGPCTECVADCGGTGPSCGPAPNGCGGADACGACPNGSACQVGKCVPDSDLPDLDLTAPVGAIAGAFAVTNGGTASYTLPIQVAPGREGMAPQLALVYSGGKQDSPLGLGWGLAGASTVTRCNRTYAQDGAAAPVTFTEDDAFCLDGQRLIKIRTLTFEEEPAVEYRTEIDSFSRVYAIGPDYVAFGGYAGPRRFKVWTKAGPILTLGGTDNSSISVDGRPLVKRAWLLDRVEDRRGNFMEYRYQHFYSDPITREHSVEALLESVRYGGHTNNTLHDREVVLKWISRSYQRDLWQAGDKTQLRSKLESISVKVGGNVIRQYLLEHAAPLEDATTLLLRGVQECVPELESFACKPPTTFEYNALQPFGEPATFVFPAAPLNSQLGVLDYNGDGRDDVSFTVEIPVEDTDGDDEDDPPPPKKFRQAVKLTRDPGGAVSATLISSEPFPDFPFDFFHDGKLAQLAWVYGGGGGAFDTYEVRRDGQKLADTGIELAFLPQAHFVQDLDGDGYTDILFVKTDDTGSTVARACLRLKDSATSGFDCEPVVGPISLNTPSSFQDVDGDGVQEWFAGFPDGPTRSIGEFSRVPSNPTWFSQFTWRPTQMLVYGKDSALDAAGLTRHVVPDLNGDGLPDFLLKLRQEQNERLFVQMNTGGETPKFEPIFVNHTLSASVPFMDFGLFFDANGDGRLDLLAPWSSSDYPLAAGILQAHISHSNRLNVVIKNSGVDIRENQQLRPPVSGDFDGDGNQDILISWGNAGGASSNVGKVWFGKTSEANLLSRVQEGQGRVIKVEYKGGAAVYTPCLQECGHETIPVKNPGVLVSRHVEKLRTLSGVEVEQASFEYTYADARLGRGGRGSFGFGRRIIRELRGIGVLRGTILEMHNTSFQLAGRVKRQVSTASTIATPTTEAGQRVNAQDTLWVESPDSAPFHPVIKERTTETLESPFGASGPPAALSTTLETFEFDAYGNLKSQNTKTRNPLDSPEDTYISAETTTVSYKHETSEDYTNAWLVASPVDVSVRSIRGETAVNGWSERRRRFNYDLTELHEVASIETLAPTGQVIATTHFSNPNVYGTRQTVGVEAVEDPNAGPVLRSTTTEFKAPGLFPSSVINAEGHEFQYRYDDRYGVLVETLDPDLIQMRYVYDAFGRRTKTFHNGELRLRESYSQAAAVSVAGFSGPGQAIVARRSEAPSGQLSIVEVDGLGRPVSSASTGLKLNTPGPTDDLLHVEREYSLAGQLLKESRPHPAGESLGNVSFAYDGLNRLAVERFADGMEVHHTYPNRLNKKADVDSGVFTRNPALFGHHVTKRAAPGTLLRASFSVVDHRGNLIAVEDAQRNISDHGAVTDYHYQGFDRPVRVTPVRGEATHTEIHYNALGQIDYQIDPDVGTLNYTYNGFGETKTALNDREITTTYHYDLLGRVKEVVAQKGTDPADVSTFIYDTGIGAATGKLTGSISPDGVQTSYEYVPNDPSNPVASQGAGQIAKIIQGLNDAEFESTYKYDSLDRLARIDYPSGAKPMAVQYQYDGEGSLEAVKDANNSAAPAYWTLVDSYKGLALHTEQFGNGVEARRTYDDATGRLLTINATRPPEEPGNPIESVQNLQYTYRDDGNVLTRHDRLLHATAEQFEYDDVNRVTEVWTLDAQGNKQTQTRDFDYHRNGNLKRKSDVASSDYTYDPAHAHAVKTAGPWTFGYDATGNQISRTKTGGISQTIDYTPFNLPESVTTTPTGGGQAVTTEFTYDAFGDRIRKSAQGITTDYHAGIYERTVDTGAGTTTHKYWIYAGLRKIAQVEHVAAGTTLVDEATLYLHPDALGSTSAISGTVGVHVNQQFEPFGEREPGTDPAAKKVTAGFTGHEHDDDLGFINMRGRIQDPHIGNFLSADPYVSSPGFSQSFNRYSYVVNNPLNYVDPTGFREYICDSNGTCWDVNTGEQITPGEGDTDWGKLDEVSVVAEDPGVGLEEAIDGADSGSGADGPEGDGPDGGDGDKKKSDEEKKCQTTPKVSALPTVRVRTGLGLTVAGGVGMTGFGGIEMAFNRATGEFQNFLFVAEAGPSLGVSTNLTFGGVSLGNPLESGLEGSIRSTLGYGPLSVRAAFNGDTVQVTPRGAANLSTTWGPSASLDAVVTVRGNWIDAAAEMLNSGMEGALLSAGVPASMLCSGD